MRCAGLPVALRYVFVLGLGLLWISCGEVHAAMVAGRWMCLKINGPADVSSAGSYKLHLSNRKVRKGLGFILPR